MVILAMRRSFGRFTPFWHRALCARIHTVHVAKCLNTSSRAYLHPLRWHASVKHTVEDLLQVCGHDHQTLDTFLQLSQLLADQVQQQVVALNLKI